MIKLSTPNISPEAVRSVADVIQSGNLVYGSVGTEVEAWFESYLGAKHCFLVSSGTAALHLSLLASGIGIGDKVLVPSFTFPATINSVIQAGATPILVDVDLNTYCISRELIEDALRQENIEAHEIKAVVAVHEFGNDADSENIAEMSSEYNWLFIEDAACALGAKSKSGKMLSTIGHASAISFHPRKTVTCGEGGLVVTNNDDIAAKVNTLRNHGISRSASSIDFIEAGLNYRLSDIQAALLPSQLKELDGWLDKRKALAKQYSEELIKIPGVKPPPFQQGHSWQTYLVLLDEHIDRDNVINTLRSIGIEASIGAQYLPAYSAYKQYYANNQLANASKLGKTGLALPFCEQFFGDDTYLDVTNALAEAISE